jgi:uncharacterized membrane protein
VAKNRNNQQLVKVQAATFSGPLPPPEVLERYNLTLPGAAERIIKMAESQHEHRMDLESRVIQANIKAQKLGTVLGFVVAVIAVAGGLWLVHEGKSIAGVATVITSVAALVGAFAYGKHGQQKELAEKSSALVRNR